MNISLVLNIAAGTTPEELRALLDTASEYATSTVAAPKAERVQPSALPEPGPLEAYYMAVAGLVSRPRVATGADRERHAENMLREKKIPIPEGLGSGENEGEYDAPEDTAPLPADCF